MVGVRTTADANPTHTCPIQPLAPRGLRQGSPRPGGPLSCSVGHGSHGAMGKALQPQKPLSNAGAWTRTPSAPRASAGQSLASTTS